VFHYSGGESNTSGAFATGISIARLDAAQVCEILYWLDSVTVDYYRRRCRPTAEVLDLRLAPGNVKAELRGFLVHCRQSDWVLVLGYDPAIHKLIRFRNWVDSLRTLGFLPRSLTERPCSLVESSGYRYDVIVCCRY